MISLKAKNYVLLDYEGKLILKGSSLRSRRDERVFRELISGTARALIEGRPEEAGRVYLELAERIRGGGLPVHEFCRWESVTEKTFTNPNLKRLAEAAEGKAVGQRVAIYQRKDGSLAPVEDYAGDEDRDYLLRRLHDAASRFRDLFSEEEFRRLFPLGHAQSQEQLSLF
jgi:DNA polymerase elongation subunit (family B)